MKQDFTINKFLGLNKDTDGETSLELGEASSMSNYRVTDNYKLKLIDGYAQLFASLGAYAVKGLFIGLVSGTNYIVFACNGTLYKSVAGVNTSIGTLTTTNSVNMFTMDGNLYIQNGAKYYKWTGTGSIAEVTGYRPLIATAAPPTGGGTLVEGANLLTGAKYMSFVATAGATVYYLAETTVTSVDYVKVNGVTKTVTTHYTVNTSAGTITLVTPSTAGDIVEVGWTKTATGDRAYVEGMFYHSFLGSNNERVFMYNGTTNTRLRSGLPADGSCSAEYFVSGDSLDEIGTGEAITAIIGQSDRQIIYTTGKAYYSYEEITLVEDTEIISFPVKEINAAYGNIPVAQARLIVNNPFTGTNHGVYEWVETTFKDGRNAQWKSKRIQPDLDLVTMSTAKTWDYQAQGEYWLCVGTEVWVFNYRADVWYKFDLLDTPTCFAEYNGDMYFGTTAGEIMKFDKDLEAFNGDDIVRSWEMGFFDGGNPTMQKTTVDVYIGLKPESKSGVYVNYSTDRNPTGLATEKQIWHNCLDFGNWDFSNHSFSTNYNPQPKRVVINANMYSVIKFILTNTSDIDKESILYIAFTCNYGGKVGY